MRLTHIESEYFPFIAGVQNARVEEIMNETGTRIRVPPYTAIADLGEDSDRKHETAIVISGEKDAVKKASELIEEIYQQMVTNNWIICFLMKKKLTFNSNFS